MVVVVTVSPTQVSHMTGQDWLTISKLRHSVSNPLHMLESSRPLQRIGAAPVVVVIVTVVSLVVVVTEVVDVEYFSIVLQEEHITGQLA